jgi:hypothetical protein
VETILAAPENMITGCEADDQVYTACLKLPSDILWKVHELFSAERSLAICKASVKVDQKFLTLGVTAHMSPEILEGLCAERYPYMPVSEPSVAYGKCVNKLVLQSWKL